MDTMSYNVHLYCGTEEYCGSLLCVSYNSCRMATYIYVYVFVLCSVCTGDLNIIFSSLNPESEWQLLN